MAVCISLRTNYFSAHLIYNLFYQYRHRRLGGSRTSCAPFGFLGQSLTWRRPWSTGFQLILLRVRRSWVLQPGGGGCSTRRPHRHVTISKKPKFIRVRPLCRYCFPKTALDAALLRLSRIMLEKPLCEGRAWCGHARPNDYPLLR